MKNKLFGELFLVAVVISAAVFCVNAQSGSLDPTFAGSGIVTGSIGGSPSYANKVVVQPPLCPVCEPKLVAAVNGPGNMLYLIRSNLNGSIDTSFGNSGISQVKMSPDSISEDPRALAIQANGSIVVGSAVQIQQSKRSIIWSFGATRLEANGALDTSFAVGGRLLFDFANGVSANLRALTIQPNGSIVLAGVSNDAFAVARLLPSGAFDSSFNGSGKTLINIGRSGGASSVKIDRNGGIVLGGYRAGTGNAGNDFAVVRLNPANGSLDSSFGAGGIVITDLGGGESIFDIAIDILNNIVAVGNSVNSKTGVMAFALARYLPNGQLDPGFNGNGRFLYASPGFQSNNLTGVAIDGSGRIVAAGRRSFNPNTFAVLRLNFNGTFDQSFGGTGIVYTSVSGPNSEALSVVIQPDGGIVAAGSGGVNLSLIALVRYLP